MRFTYKGKEFMASSGNAVTDFGPELAVAIIALDTGLTVYESQEPANIETQIQWAKESGFLD